MAKEMFIKYYDKLVEVLPMDDATFIAQLYSLHLFPGNLKDEVESKPTKQEKAMHFLDNSIKPALILPDTQPLQNLLIAMQNYDDHWFGANLAKEIRNDFKDHGYWQDLSTSDSQPDAIDVLAEHFKKSYVSSRFRKRSKNRNHSLNLPKLYVPLTIAQYGTRQRQQHISKSAKEHKKSFDIFSNFREVARQQIPDRHMPLSYKLSSFRAAPSDRLTKNIEDLFVAHDNSLILVEGMPGIGKTELVKEMALCWAKGKILQENKLLFLLFLREPNVCLLESIDDFIHRITRDFINNDQAACVIKQLKSSQGSRVVFLLDGFDECCDKLDESCFIMRLINREVLYNAVVLITSRPNATYHLRDKADKLVNVIGFADEEQDLYISQALEESPDKKERLKNHMKKNFLAFTHCYIPLYSAMLVSLLIEDCLPETLTEIIGKFVLYTVHCYLRNSHGTQYTPSMRFQTLNDLPEIAFKIICQLSRLAFDGINKNEFVFPLKVVKEV